MNIGDQVLIRGCPHVWTIYGRWPWGCTVHLQRWDNEKSGFVRQTFVHPNTLVAVKPEACQAEQVAILKTIAANTSRTDEFA